MKCCICGKEINGFGNNPYPLCHKDDYKSRCCNDCDSLVLQARIECIKGKEVADVQKKYLGKVCKK